MFSEFSKNGNVNYSRFWSPNPKQKLAQKNGRSLVLKNEEKCDNLLSKQHKKNVNALCGVDCVLPGKPNEKCGKTYENTKPDGPLGSFEAAYLLHR